MKIIDGLDDVTLAYRGTKNAENPARRENYFLLISQYQDADGNTVNVPVYINEVGQYNQVMIETNKIATAFGRDNFNNYITKEIQKGNLIKIKNRSVQDSERTALIAGGYVKNTSTGSIPQNSQDVNTFSEKSSNDVKYSLKEISISDVEMLRSIERKSINEFSNEDIEKAEPWAKKFYAELGTKSPFFRAWFGDWRAYDQSKIKTVTVENIDIADVVMQNGDYGNTDTGWTIHVGSLLQGDTVSHSRGEKVSVKALNDVKNILENAVLLDTEISEKNNNKKSVGTAFMHKMYAPIMYNGAPYIAKISIEEFLNVADGKIMRRGYNLRAIKIEAVNRSLTDNVSATTPQVESASINSIADLHALVKVYDKDFSPKDVNPVLLNEDGTPKVFYHGTNAKFTEFKPEELRKREGSYFFAENREDAAAYGKNIMEVYISSENLADYDNQPREFYKLENKRKQVEWLKERGFDGWYADMDSGGWGEISVFNPTQIKSATDNIGTFNRYNPDIRYSLKGTFTEQVDEVFGGKDTTSTHLRVLEHTPRLLQDIGLDDKPMLITAVHTKTAVGIDVKNKNIHNLDIETLKDLPNLIENPAMIMDSTKAGSIVMFVNAKDVDGNPILCAIKVNGRGLYNNVELESNVVTSVYGKEGNISNFIKKAIIESRLLYWNKKMSQSIFEDPGLQLPDEINNLDSNVIIRQTRANVNTFSEKSSNDVKYSLKAPGEFKTSAEETEYLNSLSEGDRAIYLLKKRDAADWEKFNKELKAEILEKDKRRRKEAEQEAKLQVKEATKETDKKEKYPYMYRNGSYSGGIIYTKSESESVINNIVESYLSFGEKYGVLSGKTKAIERLWRGLNTAEPGKRAKVALDLSEYILKYTAVKNIHENPELAVYRDTVALLKPYLQSIDLSPFKAEIKQQYGNDNSVRCYSEKCRRHSHI